MLDDAMAIIAENFSEALEHGAFVRYGGATIAYDWLLSVKALLLQLHQDAIQERTSGVRGAPWARLVL